MMQDNDDTRRTIHDCLGSLALLPNEPVMVTSVTIGKSTNQRITIRGKGLF